MGRTFSTRIDKTGRGGLLACVPSRSEQAAPSRDRPMPEIADHFWNRILFIASSHPQRQPPAPDAKTGFRLMTTLSPRLKPPETTSCLVAKAPTETVLGRTRLLSPTRQAGARRSDRTDCRRRRRIHRAALRNRPWGALVARSTAANA
jgi:hypothetical protein